MRAAVGWVADGAHGVTRPTTAGLADAIFRLRVAWIFRGVAFLRWQGLNPNAEIAARATVVGSAHCDDLARVQRAKGMVLNGPNANSDSAPDTARGQRSALTLPTERRTTRGRRSANDPTNCGSARSGGVGRRRRARSDAPYHGRFGGCDFPFSGGLDISWGRFSAVAGVKPERRNSSSRNGGGVSALR